MEQSFEEMNINGKVYVPKGQDYRSAQKIDGMECVLVRTYSAGVHFGYLKSRENKNVELVKSIRIWRWDGADSLSQIAVDGVGKPENCKFSVEVSSIILTEAIEIIALTEKARINLYNVKTWKI